MAGANCLSDYLPIVVNLEQVEGAGLCANTHIRWPSWYVRLNTDTDIEAGKNRGFANSPGP